MLRNLKSRHVCSLATALLFSGLLNAAPMLQDNAPNEYLVQKGDTLWDISGVFLKSPWRWPEIWNKNKQIVNPDLIYPYDVIYLQYDNGVPFLSKHKPGVVKLKPKIRLVDPYAALSAIPREVIKSFIVDRRIVLQEFVDNSPYVVANIGDSELIALGDSIFIRGNFDLDYPLFDVYRAQEVYGAEAGLKENNIEIVKVGQIEVSILGDKLSQAVVVEAKDVLRPSDILLPPIGEDAVAVYNLSAGPTGLTGKIIRATGTGDFLSRYDGAVIDLGLVDGLKPGDVLKVLKESKTVTDPITKEEIVVDSQSVGNLVIVNAFDNVSYGLVLNATGIIAKNYKVISVR